jgi:choline kinase
MVTSLISANEWLETDTCITSYSDIVYTANTVNKLASFPDDIVIAYDPNWLDLWRIRFENPLLDVETFRLSGNTIFSIGKKASFVDEIEGQYMGLLKYTPAGWAKVKDYLIRLSEDQIDNLDITNLLQRLIDVGMIKNAVPIYDKWFEVDTESDLNIYHSEYKTSPIN